MSRALDHRYRTFTLTLTTLIGAMALGASPTVGQPVATPACAPHVLRGVLPVWARAGFSESAPRVPHVLSAHGKLAAILFGDPLSSPPPRDHNNKILWVSRVAAGLGSDLRISAQRMSGSTPVGAPVRRKVFGGPGPSIIDLPVPGCWRLTLRWSGQTDTADLAYR